MHESGEVSVTEENARHGDAGAAAAPSGPAAGASLPPKPTTPPTSATPVVPAALPHSSPESLPQSVPETRPESGPKFGPRSAPRPALTAARGAAKQAKRNAARLVRWVRRQSLTRIGAAVVAVAVVGLLVWLLSATLGGSKSSAEAPPAPAAASSPSASASASRGALPLEGVSAMDFQLNDCFKDFDPDAPQATVVACNTGHSAQLVAIAKYDKADTYPGRDPLRQRARSACKAAPLAEKSSTYELGYKLAYPSSSSWEKGDRRVDCYVITNAGNVIMESLRP